MRLEETYLRHPVDSSFPGQQVPAGGQGREVEKRDYYLFQGRGWWWKKGEEQLFLGLEET